MSRKSTDTRQRILAAAQQSVDDGTLGPVEEIARRAGVSRQAVYLHFGSRAGLMLALVHHVDRTVGVGEAVASLEDEADPRARFWLGLARIVEIEPRVHGVAMALHRLAADDPDVRVAFEDRMRARRSTLQRLLEPLWGVNGCGSTWTLEEAVDLLWEVTSPTSYEHLVVERRWPVHRFAAWVYAVAGRVLGVPQAGSGRGASEGAVGKRHGRTYRKER